MAVSRRGRGGNARGVLSAAALLMLLLAFATVVYTSRSSSSGSDDNASASFLLRTSGRGTSLVRATFLRDLPPSPSFLLLTSPIALLLALLSLPDVPLSPPPFPTLTLQLALLLAGKGDGPHKPFWPMDQQDVITIALATLGLIVAAGGGIGGGGILVPLYILVLGFSPRRAIPLSNVTILVREEGREEGKGRKG